MTIRIDSITLSDPVILAPMTGVSDLPFRTLVKRFGVGMVVSEMIASRAMVMEKRDTLRMASFTPEEYPFAVQLAGCEPEVMAEAAKLNEARGATLIDINFGCPVKKVAVNSYAGSALMKDEPLAAKILEATAKAVKIPVTLKMRMGWDQSNLNAPRIARIAEECGIKMITVHGRTRAQMYNGHADWGFIQSVKDAVKLPVVANGDITNFEDVDNARTLSGADGVMIGRGTYGRPWFPAQVCHYLKTGEKKAAPSLTQQKAIVLEHYEDMLRHYGMQQGMMIARKHIGWYAAGKFDAAAFRNRVNQQADAEEVKRMIADFFAMNEERAARGDAVKEKSHDIDTAERSADYACAA